MGNIVFWIVSGVIVGLVAKSVVPSEGPRGVLGDLVVGISGAFIGGGLFTVFLGHSYSGWIGSTAVAFVGAVAFLLVLRTFSNRPLLPQDYQ